MEKALKILSAVTSILLAAAEIMKQVNQYNASNQTSAQKKD